MTDSGPVGKNRFVIDTNVLIVANRNASHATADCVLSAVDFLDYAYKNAIIVHDSGREIFEEYANYCSYSGQPGVGDRFFQLIHRSQADTTRVQQVEIHPKGDRLYEETPDCLADFDPSDQKFIATVVADERRSTIVNCVDSDWRNAATELDEAGIEVIQLCD